MPDSSLPLLSLHSRKQFSIIRPKSTVTKIFISQCNGVYENWTCIQLPPVLCDFISFLPWRGWKDWLYPKIYVTHSCHYRWDYGNALVSEVPLGSVQHPQYLSHHRHSGVLHLFYFTDETMVMPWYLKFLWVLFNILNTSAIIVTVAYYIFLEYGEYIVLGCFFIKGAFFFFTFYLKILQFEI